MAARKTIPRGCREQYIPGLSNAALSLYDQYRLGFSENPFGEETLALGESLLQEVGEERRTWQNMIESTDLKYNSKKSWPLMRRLSNDPTTSTTHTNITANEVSQQVLLNGKSSEQHRKSGAYREKSNILAPR